jgi:tRNA(Arg) A34 adenosine deaminase TadA
VAFVLDSRGRILTEGWNSYTKTHPIQKKAADEAQDPHKCFLHAEIHALSRLSYKQLSKQDTIVVLRLDGKYRLMPSKPCPICQDVICQYGIKNIIHS